MVTDNPFVVRIIQDEKGKSFYSPVFCTANFGLSSIPHIFTKVMGEALAPLRKKGLNIVTF